MEEIKHFTVKELSKMVGIPLRRIQFYLLQNLITPDLGVSSGKGVAHKFSFGNAVELFFIKELSDMGVTLSVIKEILSVKVNSKRQLGSLALSVRQFLLTRGIVDGDPFEKKFNSYFLISQKESGIEVLNLVDESDLVKRLQQRKGTIVINLTNIIKYINKFFI